MAKRKAKKQQKKAETPVPELAPGPAAEKKAKYNLILACIVTAYFFYYIGSLFSSLSEVHFWADENVHAYISSVIFKTKSLPAVLPEEVYGGFEYSYPPLFHILNALVLATAGFAALKYVNLILFILFLTSFFFLIRKHYGSDIAWVACLLISLSPTIAINSVRFMTEMLSMLLVFYSFFSCLVAVKTGKTFYALLSGFSGGLLMLSKQIGIVVLSFYVLLSIWFYFKRRKDLKLILCIVVTTACVFTPYLIWAIYNRIAIFGFISLFMGNQPEWAIMAVRSFRKHDSALMEFIELFYTGNGLIVSVSFLLPLFHFIRTRARNFPQNYMFLMTLYLIAVTVIWHITNARHTIILLPLITFLTGYSLYETVIKKSAMKVAILLLLIVGSYSTYYLPDYRKESNAPVVIKEITEFIRKNNPSNGRTLVIQAFDFLMYTKKPVIWPYANLRDNPTNLFETQPPDKLYDLLKQYNIKFILIDRTNIRQTDEFMGRNFPVPFVNNCLALIQKGKISVQGTSETRNYTLLKTM